jgi:hypothetical protein
MGATRRLFRYKCVKGHVTEKSFPLGTRFDDYDEIPCPECIKKSAVQTAYLISADAGSVGEQRNGKSIVT